MNYQQLTELVAYQENKLEWLQTITQDDFSTDFEADILRILRKLEVEYRPKKGNVPFDDFWNLYDKKINPAKSKQLWERLNTKEQEAAMAYIPAYKNSCEKIYRKNPEGFLKNKKWNDEIVIKKQEQPKTIARNTGWLQ
jgi:hypothetical protein